ncbi:MAG: glycosyltransferase [Ignavibacteria bacterium]|nr:glycosyltransferase [Ignavibacteria bacterium]
MYIVHWTGWAPRQSGMFESVKDQIKYERKAGLQSDMADPNEKYKEGGETILDDGWFSPISWKQAESADIYVMHSWIPDEIKKLQGKKHVAILHGPTEHMLWKEWVSNRKEEAFNLHINILWKYDATIVLNKHEFDIMKLYDEYSRLHYIPNSIDLERYQNKEIQTWKYRNHPAIISCDVIRLEKLPAHIIWAMPRIAEKIPEARLNLFCLQLEPISTWRNIFCRSHLRNLEHLCESIQLENNELRPFMKGADIGFNNNVSGIASRVTMEMQAMGIPVISYGGEYTPYIAKIWDLDSITEQVIRCWNDLTKEGSKVMEETRRYARKNYDRAERVKEYITLYNKLMEK